jgi:hypothetical protein
LLPTLTRSYPRRFTFYVADPASSIPKPIFFKSAASNIPFQMFTDDVPGMSRMFGER